MDSRVSSLGYQEGRDRTLPLGAHCQGKGKQVSPVPRLLGTKSDQDFGLDPIS